MTLIECFDRRVNANIVSCLHLRPKKVIFLGDSTAMPDEVERYQDFFDRRDMDVDIKYEWVTMDNIDEIADTLHRFVRMEAPCVIDVTGGDERLLMAVGMLLSRLTPELRKQVAVQKFDKETGEAVDCDGDGKVVQGYPVNVTVEEVIRLRHGRPSSSSDLVEEMYRAKDLDPIWEIACAKGAYWNRLMSALIHAESFVTDDEWAAGTICLPAETLQLLREDYPGCVPMARELLDRFMEKGIIEGRLENNHWDYHYTSALYRLCTEKHGTILEVKTLLESREVLDCGKPYFHDHLMSVSIEWLNPDRDPDEPKTYNEIDLILTRGLIPLFVSCKNGEVDDEELYKLNSVANHFGGPDVKKLLIGTQLKVSDNKSIDAFIQRAEAMGIYVVTNAKDLEKADWRNVFKTAFKK